MADNKKGGKITDDKKKKDANISGNATEQHVRYIKGGIIYHNKLSDFYRNLNNICLTLSCVGSVAGIISITTKENNNYWALFLPVLGLTIILLTIAYKWGEESVNHREFAKRYTNLSKKINELKIKNIQPCQFNLKQKKYFLEEMYLIRQDAPATKLLLYNLCILYSLRNKNRSLRKTHNLYHLYSVSVLKESLAHFFSFSRYTLRPPKKSKIKSLVKTKKAVRKFFAIFFRSSNSR